MLCMSQGLPREYFYDEAGNRILRKVIELNPAPPNIPDSTQVASYELQEPQFFVENIAKVEIKIYPNPTTEKITLEILGWESLKTGVFKLCSLNGVLLQEQPVHSITTTISLAGLPKGVYILTVNINGVVEDWKIIKN